MMVDIKIKEQSKKYDWKITALKVSKATLYVVLAGLAAVYGNSPWYMAVAPLLHGLENIVRHYQQ